MIGIIAAMEQEARALLENMKEVQTTRIHHLEYISGLIHGKEVVVTQSGIGKVNSALATAFLIDRFQPELVINTGSAGGIKPGLKVGDVLIGDVLSYHDVDATAFGYQKGQVPQMPAVYESHPQIIQEMKTAIDSIGLHHEIGMIVSSDSFVANASEVARIRQEFPGAGATEMEGASIAQTCYTMEVPFVVVRAISDSADEEASVSFDEFIEVAGKNSAEMVMNFLEEHQPIK